MGTTPASPHWWVCWGNCGAGLGKGGQRVPIRARRLSSAAAPAAVGLPSRMCKLPSIHLPHIPAPTQNVVWQEMDSKALKRAYGMEPHQKGVLVGH